LRECQEKLGGTALRVTPGFALEYRTVYIVLVFARFKEQNDLVGKIESSESHFKEIHNLESEVSQLDSSSCHQSFRKEDQKENSPRKNENAANISFFASGLLHHCP
jgi:hypothetical protein